MPEFRFKRIETVEYDIAVYADSPEQAYARAAVGSMGCVRSKEGVEVTGCSDHSEVARMAGLERIDAYKEIDEDSDLNDFLTECKGVDPNTIFFRAGGRYRVLAYVPREFAERAQMVTEPGAG